MTGEPKKLVQKCLEKICHFYKNDLFGESGHLGKNDRFSKRGHISKNYRFGKSGHF